jgi:Tol biopolymer transport system component
MILLVVALLFTPSAVAQRAQVLEQIDLPHAYYLREMYVPQLTTGPSSVAWSPDSKTVVYSMAGSLWRQAIDASVAEQLTAGSGYDYEPDWSPDGKWIVYSSYQNDAIELYALELATGKSRQLTSSGALNLEPRWSPDGNRIVYVSTTYNKRFHIFVADWMGGGLGIPERITGETRSTLPRYYYSPFDTEISPVWSPDGDEIVFISNRDHLYGSGGIWRMRAAPGAEPHEIHAEETTWKARPDWSRDGKRIVFSSYSGRQWHQLWALPATGGSAIPLSYGEFDATAARFSPDGRCIAFISNREGNTSLWMQEVLGGEQHRLDIRERKYLVPMGRLRISVTDAAGKPTSARVSVTAAGHRAYAPFSAWMHADDGYDRAERPFEAHYFHSIGTATLDVPAGQVEIEVMKGDENSVERKSVTVSEDETTSISIRLRPFELPATPEFRWVSGDLHVHMNYNGAYRNTPKNLVAQAQAENLSVVHALIVNKEQRIPDVSYFTGKLDPASTAETLLLFGQEYHTSDWGHLGLLNLKRNLIIPDYAAYPLTVAASLFPTNSAIADLAHAQGGLVGYVHPFEEVPDPSKDARLINALPMDVALGKADYIEVLGFSDHRSTADVWYRLLNCGFRFPTGAGTDATPNFAATLHGVVGMNRVYVRVPAGPLKMESWLEGLRRGRTFATNGPLLRFSLGGKEIGDEIKLASGRQELKFTAALRSIVPIDHLQLVCNGQVAKDVPLAGHATSADASGSVALEKSGWCVLRAWSEKAESPVMDIYPYATTSPIYVTLGDAPPRSAADAAYFAAWLDRVREAVEAHQGWNTDAERANVLKSIEEARAVFVARQKE